MNYREFRLKKMREYDIRETCWGVPDLGEQQKRLIHSGKYSVTYRRTGRGFWVNGSLTLHEYIAAELEFMESFNE